MKRFKRLGVFAGRAAMVAGAVGAPVLAKADIWTQGTTAVTEATTNVTALLIVAVGIPIAFFGYKVLKRIIHGA